MSAEALQLRARDQGPLRCAYCREDLIEAIAACPDCGVQLHEACAAELIRCPSVGCGGAIGAAGLRLFAGQGEVVLLRDPIKSELIGCGCMLESIALTTLPLFVMILNQAGAPVWPAVLPAAIVFLATRGLMLQGQPGAIRDGRARPDGPLLFGRELPITVEIELAKLTTITQVRARLVLRAPSSEIPKVSDQRSSAAAVIGPFSRRATGLFVCRLVLPVPPLEHFPDRESADSDVWQLIIEVFLPGETLALQIALPLGQSPG